MNDSSDQFCERPEWGPQKGGLYRSPIPPKVTKIMADLPRSPSDLPGTVVAAPSRAVPRSHRYLALPPGEGGPSASQVADLLNRLGVKYVLVGGHAVGCWSSSPRPTADADFIVFMRDFQKAQKALQEAFPALRLEEHDAVARFTLSDAEGSEAVDLIRSYDALMLSVLENSLPVTSNGVEIRIPCPEAQVALKAAAVRSPDRSVADVAQDVADIARICEGRSLREDVLEAFSAAVGGVESGFLANVVRVAQRGGDLAAACRA